MFQWTEGVAQELQERAADTLVDEAGQLNQERYGLRVLLTVQLPVGRSSGGHVQTHFQMFHHVDLHHKQQTMILKRVLKISFVFRFWRDLI